MTNETASLLAKSGIRTIHVGFEDKMTVSWEARHRTEARMRRAALRKFCYCFAMADTHETDNNIDIWKIKKLIKALEAARGNGTSMISLIMSPRDQISRVTKMLGDEFGTASNIKSRVNRQSILGAITSAQQRLTLYSRVPLNGLVL